MKKRFFQLVLTAVLSVSCVATGVNVSAAPLSSEGYSIEKVSHPERGAGETDGILSFDAMGEEILFFPSYYSIHLQDLTAWF